MKRLAALVSVGVVVAVFALLAPASSAQQPMKLGHHVRFDLVHIVQGTLLAGGTDVGKDAPSGDTVSLTGTGGFKPATADAAGGGTFVHQHRNGSEVAHGVWVVTSFASWAPAGGSIIPLGITDGIGEASETSAGILALNVRLFPAGTSSTLDALLEVHCNLPGASFPTEEGIRLVVAPFVFEQDGGGTVFHILE